MNIWEKNDELFIQSLFFLLYFFVLGRKNILLQMMKHGWQINTNRKEWPQNYFKSKFRLQVFSRFYIKH